MGTHQILPSSDQVEKEVALIHRNGEIISINNSIYQVRLFSDPKRKIFTTSIECAYKILKQNNYDYNENDFLCDEK